MTTTTQGSEESSNVPGPEAPSDSLEHWIKDIRTDLSNDPPDWAPGVEADDPAAHMEGEIVSVTDTLFVAGAAAPESTPLVVSDLPSPTVSQPVSVDQPVVAGAATAGSELAVGSEPVAVGESAVASEPVGDRSAGAAAPAPARRVGRHRAPDPDKDSDDE